MQGDGWQITKIKELGRVVTGNTPSTSKKEFYGGSYKLISPADLDSGKYVVTSHRTLSEKGLHQCRALPKDAVLVGCIGNIGKIGMTQDYLSATNQQINSIICNDNYDPHFVYYALGFHRLRLAAAAVKTTVPILNKTNFENFTISVPRLSEQRKIASVLSLIQSAIECQWKLTERSTKLKNALMQKVFTEGIRGEQQKESQIGDIPGSWSVVSLGEVITRTQYGLSTKGAESGEYPMLRMTNQLDGLISADDLQYVNLTARDANQFKVEFGDILFNRTNSFDLVGRTAIFAIKGHFVFASYLIRLAVNSSRLNPFFLNYYLNWEASQQRLKTIATRAISQSNISATRLKTFVIPVPELPEQQEIIELLDAASAKIQIHLRAKEARQSLFHNLLHRLMSAQIHVNDLNLLELRLEEKEREPSKEVV